MVVEKLLQARSELNILTEEMNEQAAKGESFYELERVKRLLQIEKKLASAYDEAKKVNKEFLEHRETCTNEHRLIDLKERNINMVKHAENSLGMESGLHDESGHTDEIN